MISIGYCPLKAGDLDLDIDQGLDLDIDPDLDLDLDLDIELDIDPDLDPDLDVDIELDLDLDLDIDQTSTSTYNLFKDILRFQYDHNYITLIYMHINFYFEFQLVQCESVVFTTLNLLAKNLTR